MQYRRFGGQDLSVSALGFGCMRLPVVGGDSRNIDEREAVRLIRYAIDRGVNYVDTAYNYHGRNSETVVGRALRGGYRERVYLATKSPVWLCESRQDLDKYLGEQTDKLGTDQIDFYLLHSLNRESWEKCGRLGALEFLDSARRDGRIRYAGFSFHDEFSVFQRIVDAYDWSLCLIHLNYVDDRYQAGVRGLEYAASRGMAVAIMEPLRGGKLAGTVPDEVRAIWDKSPVRRSPAEWALRWVWNHPEVSVVLSGMSAMEQVEENIRTAEDALPMSLTPRDLALIAEARAVYRRKIKIDCTGCGYCIPCPNRVQIPDIFSLYNDVFMYDAEAESSRMYDWLKGDGTDASACAECGRCEEACPQRLPVPRYLKEVGEFFEARAALSRAAGASGPRAPEAGASGDCSA